MTTRDQGTPHDEPYAVFCSIDMSCTPPRGHVFRTQVFGDVDEGSVRRQNVRIWGLDGDAESISDPDKIILLVGLMESDDSDDDAVVKTAFAKTMAVARDLAGTQVVRADAVAKLRKAFLTGLLEGAEADGSDDDTIGNVQTLPIDWADLDRANKTGKAQPKTLSFSRSDEQGSYVLHFNLATASKSAPS